MPSLLPELELPFKDSPPHKNYKGTVLTVDDEDLNLDILSTILEHHQYRVLQARDAKSAWALLQQYQDEIDVIVLDRLMPDVTGLEFIDWMKKTSKFNHIPVIMQTALSSEKEILEGISAGVYYYLVKPFTREMLLSLVQSAQKDRKHYDKLRTQISQHVNALHLMQECHFQAQTLAETEALSSLIAPIFRNAEDAVLGLSELMINAIEHGNLGIGYHEKTILNQQSRWEDEVHKRLELPQHKHKKIKVSAYQLQDMVEVHIRDEGEGFDWQAYLEISPERITDNHGRGIPIARNICFDQVEYLGKGNHVVCRSAKLGIK
ncbi:MAG: response regulator [Alphaproteobacteria bacterium]|nr:response regulator [Alphaproteobacteria bacterium]